LNRQRYRLILIGILVLVSHLIISAYAEAPFSIDITPKDAVVKVGDTVKYKCMIEASPGFDDSITFTIRVKALGYDVTQNIGTVNPPYPQEFSYDLVIPESIPLGMEATATIIGESGEHTVEENVKLSIKKEGIPGFPIESIIVGLATGALILWMLQRRQGHKFESPFIRARSL
jgi:hypothetical protein